MSNEPESIVKCPNCGAERPAGILSCSKCGFGSEIRFHQCPNCQRSLQKSAPFCPHCGANQSNSHLGWWVAGLVILGLPVGCAGTCGLLYSLNTSDYLAMAISLGGVGLLAYFIYKTAQAAKK